MNYYPKISILLCCYNYDKFVAEAIQSVLDQTYDNFELLIADDCSTDNSAEVIKKFDDPRITFIQNETNLGFMGTRNKLLKMVNCEYVAFQDADDVWIPTKLEEQMKHMLTHPECAACFTSADLIDENSKKYTDKSKCDIPLDTFNKNASAHEEIIREFFFEGNFISHPSALLKKNTLDELGAFNKRLIQVQDYDYWCKIAGRYNVYVLNKVLMHVRRISKHHVGLSANEQSNIRTMNELVEVMRDLFDNMKLDIFCDSFKDFVVHLPTNETELICEKYFLLLKWKCLGWNNKLPALQFFNENFSPEVEKTLKEKYNYTIDDYYKESGQMIYLYPIFLYKEFEDLQRHTKNLEQIIKQQKQELKSIYDSKSWKITEPLRKIRK